MIISEKQKLYETSETGSNTTLNFDIQRRMAAHVRSKLCSSVFRCGLFKNKVAIVSGGGTGIGKAIATELLYLGCKVVIASRNAKKLEAGAEEIRTWLRANNHDSELHIIPCNIRKEEEVQNLISTTVKNHGQLDFLVNNGGGQFLSPAKDIQLKGWNAVIETNLTGTFLMCREAYNQWMKDHGGAIVNIIADMWKGFPMLSHTGAARAGVDNLTKSLSLEWVHSGVRVNSVAPGVVYSETAAANYKDKNVFELAKPLLPYHRLGTVEEISSAVCFLLSPGARFITGETVRIDGGASNYSCHTLQIPGGGTATGEAVTAVPRVFAWARGVIPGGGSFCGGGPSLNDRGAWLRLECPGRPPADPPPAPVWCRYRS
ncbi:peroxisomal trans-2-enoyl-coa reductase-like [Plakobranchus ocellatus]|uniref:Peroxisomal trans-2-enoyl-CoA reductase n=1 Tax=Plakobranchus ocellatus TaxID=259542 RepID=A0AAV4A0K2_9GAST|nr:peroxisomal trans-2-enoyl-coa reductase-like [Plakobranchus ocellatus]